jgi:hypothetical protein
MRKPHRGAPSRCCSTSTMPRWCSGRRSAQWSAARSAMAWSASVRRERYFHLCVGGRYFQTDLFAVKCHHRTELCWRASLLLCFSIECNIFSPIPKHSDISVSSRRIRCQHCFILSNPRIYTHNIPCTRTATHTHMHPHPAALRRRPKAPRFFAPLTGFVLGGGAALVAPFALIPAFQVICATPASFCVSVTQCCLSASVMECISASECF